MEEIKKSFIELWNKEYEHLVIPIEQKKELRKIAYIFYVHGVNKEGAKK